MKIETNEIKAAAEPKSSWSQIFLWVQIRPYGILLTVILGLYLYKVMNNRTAIKLIPPSELATKVHMVSEQFVMLRRDHPTIFCGVSTLILGTLAIIGHLISGANLVLIGLIVAGFISTRYKFKVVKIPLKVDFTWADKYDNDIVDDFLPEVNESNLFVLERASNEAIISAGGGAIGSAGTDDDEKSEEIPSDLMIPDSIPEIDENSSDSSDDNLFVKKSQQQPISLDDNQEIQFKKGYFKKDSSLSTTSSSDEECLSKGLNFDYVDSGMQNQELSTPLQKSQSTPQSSSSITGNIASQIPGFMSHLTSWNSKNGDKKIPDNLTRTTIQKNQKLDSSDDESDFEIVEKESI